MKNRIPLDYKLTKEIDLPSNSFVLLDSEYSVPCVFQMWEKTSTPRTIAKQALVSKYIQFVSANEADFRIQRVGGNAGKAFANLNAAASSNYFIKNISKTYNNSELISIINILEYQSLDHTTGPKSLSKGELIYSLEEYIIKENI